MAISITKRGENSFTIVDGYARLMAGLEVLGVVEAREISSGKCYNIKMIDGLMKLLDQETDVVAGILGR